MRRKHQEIARLVVQKPQYDLAQVETPKVDSSLWVFNCQRRLPEGARINPNARHRHSSSNWASKIHVPAQDVQFFYTCSHFSALQNCALLFSINFQFIFILKKCITQFSHWIVSCTIFSKNIAQVFIKFMHSFVAIELLTFCKNAKKLFYCSRELSLFWLNK